MTAVLPPIDSETQTPSSTAKEFRRSWRVVIAAALGLGFGAGSSLYWFGVLIGPLSREFGWSTSAISGWSLALNIAANIFAPLSGMLVDRIGARIVALWSIPLIALGFASVGVFMNSLWVLYLGAFVIGLAGSGTAAYTRAINSWFNAGRGTALGIALSGIGLVSIVGPRISQAVVDSMGWRIGFVFMGAMTLLPLPAAFLWLHERRETAGRTPVPSETGYRMLEVLRLRAFWLIGLGGLLYFLCYMGVQFSLIPFLTDRGVSRANAAYYAGVLGAFTLIGKLIAGAIFDRARAPFVLAFLLLVDAVAVVMLVSVQTSNAIFALVIVGFVQGGVMAAIPYCVARYFGLKFFASISGLINALLGLSAFGPVLFSILRDTSGSYSTSLIVSSGLVFGAATLFAVLGLHPYIPDATGDAHIKK